MKVWTALGFVPHAGLVGWAVAARLLLGALPLPKAFAARRWLIPLARLPVLRCGVHRLDATELGRAVSLATRATGSSRPCLPRSYVASVMLAARGLCPVVVIGMRREGERLAGHAWIELDGEVILESAEAARGHVSMMRFELSPGATHA